MEIGGRGWQQQVRTGRGAQPNNAVCVGAAGTRGLFAHLRKKRPARRAAPAIHSGDAIVIMQQCCTTPGMVARCCPAK